jgi:hypothetical protein
MLYNNQNYWVFGLCPSSGILETREGNVSETGSATVLRRGGRHLLRWIPWEELTSIQKLCSLVFRVPDDNNNNVTATTTATTTTTTAAAAATTTTKD